MKITEVLDLAEELNKVLPECVNTEVEVKDIESDEDLISIINQERGNLFEPTTDLPYYWGTVKLDKVKFILTGIKKEVKVTF